MLQTQGINPYFLTETEIIVILSNELKINPTKVKVDELHFYGAGINHEDKQSMMERVFQSYFNCKKVKCHSDMLAAARATCKKTKGITCILGTGSNTAYFDGKKIGFKTQALGYILGDEGGGSYLGKKVLQYYLHDIFDSELQASFKKQFADQLPHLMDSIYRKPLANRFIAQFAHFIFDHRGHYMIENIAEDGLNDLFINHLLRYPGIHKLPVHFTGSVSFFLKDILKNLCAQYDIKMGVICRNPIKELIEFHQ